MSIKRRPETRQQQGVCTYLLCTLFEGMNNTHSALSSSFCSMLFSQTIFFHETEFQKYRQSYTDCKTAQRIPFLEKIVCAKDGVSIFCNNFMAFSITFFRHLFLSIKRQVYSFFTEIGATESPFLQKKSIYRYFLLKIQYLVIQSHFKVLSSCLSCLCPYNHSYERINRRGLHPRTNNRDRYYC